MTILGNNIDPTVPPDPNRTPGYVRAPTYIGKWFPIANSSIGVERTSLLASTYQFFLKWSDGGRTNLSNEEFAADGDLLNFSPIRFADPSRFTYHDIRIKTTRNTLPWLIANGYVPKEEGERLIRESPRPPDPPSSRLPPPSITETVGKVATAATAGAGALTVVALVAGAIWFFPRMRG